MRPAHGIRHLHPLGHVVLGRVLRVVRRQVILRERERLHHALVQPRVLHKRALLLQVGYSLAHRAVGLEPHLELVRANVPRPERARMHLRLLSAELGIDPRDLERVGRERGVALAPVHLHQHLAVREERVKAVDQVLQLAAQPLPVPIALLVLAVIEEHNAGRLGQVLDVIAVLLAAVVVDLVELGVAQREAKTHGARDGRDVQPHALALAAQACHLLHNPVDRL